MFLAAGLELFLDTLVGGGDGSGQVTFGVAVFDEPGLVATDKISRPALRSGNVQNRIQIFVLDLNGIDDLQDGGLVRSHYQQYRFTYVINHIPG